MEQYFHLTLNDEKLDFGRFSLSNICNMDLTSLPFEYFSSHTYAMKGDKTLLAKASKSGWDKRQKTIMLTVFADVISRLVPLIILNGTEDLARQTFYHGEERMRYDPRAIVWFNQKGYVNEEIMLK